jgi:response regulator NasT
VFKLDVPLMKNDLICSLEMFAGVDTADFGVRKKSAEDERLINRAKKVLIDRYDMTEEQAHRYIQKKSMDTGKKITDISRIIANLR